tara:strand:+ start:4644 stop:5177 length:534 start_codon:yes stop_codon:yes gene_type:complete
MMIAAFFTRFIFYGSVICVAVLTFYFLDFCVAGESAHKLFIAIALVSGLVQSANFLVIRKLSDIQKVEGLGFWARWRLRLRAEERRNTAFIRAAVGVLAALGSAAMSAWMNILAESHVPFWMLGIASGFSLLSITMLFLTLYEYYVVSKLETDIHWKAEDYQKKQDALKSIRGEEDK